MGPLAGVVLAGGASTRMGTPKALLEWHGSTLLRRIVGLVGRAADLPVVVVRAPDQRLPPLPEGVRVVEDAEEGRGPLQGLAAGLAACDGAELAFVCATDAPFVHPAVVLRLARMRGDADAVLPVVDGYRQPLAACYRPELAEQAVALLAAGRSRMTALLDDAAVRVVEDSELRADPVIAARDPELRTFRSLDTPEDYAQARALPAPAVTVERIGVHATAAGAGSLQVRAATLGAAASAAGLVLDRHLLAAVDGDSVGRDPATPLAHGDTVTFLSADAGG